MPAEISMPQLTDTMTDGTVVKWLKREGEKVAAGEKIAEVETDKAVMEMESFDGGTLAVILTREGEKAEVGKAIAVVAGAKDDVAAIKAKYASGGVAANPVAQPVPATAGVGADAGSNGPAASMVSASTSEIHEPADVGHGATRGRPTAVPAIANTNVPGRLVASPLAKRIAADLNIDLKLVHGTGPGGRVVQKDVLAYKPAPAAPVVEQKPEQAKAPAAAPATPAPAKVSRGDKQVIPLTKMRQAIAKGLQASKQNVPHFYETVDVDVEELSALRLKLNASLESEKVRLSIGDLISKAVAVALLKHPALNAHYNGTANEITRFGDVHLGFAVALPDGLIVPVLRNIDQMGLREIRAKSGDLIDRARAQRLKQDEMTGATFTVSNLGTFGVREFSAIINPPSVGILAVAAAEKRAVVRNDQIVIRTMMTVTLSADHRAVDGAVAAEFLRTLKGLLEEPGLMLV